MRNDVSSTIRHGYWFLLVAPLHIAAYAIVAAVSGLVALVVAAATWDLDRYGQGGGHG